MKKLLYPKTYAVIKNIITKNDIWIPLEGKVLVYPELPTFVFETDDGREIVAKYPRTSGSIPNRIWIKWRKRDKKQRYKPWDYLLGCRVKLYLRPQDAGRWSYRHLGE